MRKPDEIAFYAALRERARGAPHPGSPAVAQEAARIGIPYRRAVRLLEKWTDRGWWEFGVTVTGGWFTAKAPESLAEGEG